MKFAQNDDSQACASLSRARARPSACTSAWARACSRRSRPVASRRSCGASTSIATSRFRTRVATCYPYHQVAGALIRTRISTCLVTLFT